MNHAQGAITVANLVRGDDTCGDQIVHLIEIDSLPAKYNGIYTVLDTGPAIQGREVDLYMWSCNEALRFGRRPTHINVLRLGWNPRASSPTFFDRFFSRPRPVANISLDQIGTH